jgi:NTP pyrophosphatase (non-canonical NTP hydrolase)
MFMNDYQTAARKTAANNSLNHFVSGLTEEAGEVSGVMKRFYRGDEQYRKADRCGFLPDLSLFAKEKLKAEIGDVLWYIAMIADELETPLEEIAFNNIAKLKDRQARNVLTGSGDNR